MLQRVPPRPELPADEELVERIHRGDRSAEAALVAKYSRGLMCVIRRRAPEHAEDIHQEAFRAIIERLRERGLEEPAKLGHFLLRIARNLVLRAYRETQRRPLTAFDDVIEGLEEPAPGPYRQLASAQLAQCVRRVIHELHTERDRAILYRFYIAGTDKEQICAELGLDPVHFNRVLFRARERFRELMIANNLYDPEDDHESH